MATRANGKGRASFSRSGPQTVESQLPATLERRFPPDISRPEGFDRLLMLFLRRCRILVSLTYRDSCFDLRSTGRRDAKNIRSLLCSTKRTFEKARHLCHRFGPLESCHMKASD